MVLTVFVYSIENEHLLAGSAGPAKRFLFPLFGDDFAANRRLGQP